MATAMAKHVLKLSQINIFQNSWLLTKQNRSNIINYGLTCHRYSSEKNGTDFGFERVTYEEKARKVNDIFSKVASQYDFMNDVMSGGTHRLLKDELMRTLNPLPGTQLIDVAGGTGDIAFRFIRRVENTLKFNKNWPTCDSNSEVKESHVTVFDLNENMLKVGKARAIKGGFTNISWVNGNAENLPFEDNTFDAYTISWGIRNVSRKDLALTEAYRVLKPGGRFLCLEFSNVKNPILATLYDWYSFQIIPVMGQIIAKDWKSYQYLVESIRKFPKQEEFRLMIEEAGFCETIYKNYIGGVAAIHSGYKL